VDTQIFHACPVWIYIQSNITRINEVRCPIGKAEVKSATTMNNI
jgi:hypothetical protein